MILNNSYAGICCAVLSMFLGGCATLMETTEPVTPPLADLSAQATAATSAGKPDKALSILENATKLYPADKAPWVQIAQIKFDAASYGEAIVNALEALHRDPQDQVANSIVAVGGLRLSSKALTSLSQQKNMSGSVRTEAQELAKLLRESLGETELVPVVPAQGAAPVTPPIAKPAAPAARSAKRKAARNNAARATAPVGQDSGNANPFGVLK